MFLSHTTLTLLTGIGNLALCRCVVVSRLRTVDRQCGVQMCSSSGMVFSAAADCRVVTTEYLAVDWR